MINKEFIHFLIQKLKNGNRASIHLNALPSNYTTRLDLGRLNEFKNGPEGSVFCSDIHDAGIGNQLIDLLLTNDTFSIDIDFQYLSHQELTEVESDKLKYISKRLDSIYYQNIDNYLEYGIKTLGIGYPLLIKRDRKDAKKIIKAPLLIWQFEIEKSKNKINTWVLKREADFNITLNEILISHIFNDEGALLETIPAEYLEDRIIQKEELISLCKNILGQLNQSAYECTEIKLNNCRTSKAIDSNFQSKAYIEWAAIFGIYKNQKQSIIKELEFIADHTEQFEIRNEEKLIFESKFTAIDTDPSQERIIHNFANQEIKVIQGPPGTGKSQTLTAIISNALENNKKCLVVCEKKTALEVIFNNLENLGIGSLCGIIEDLGRDRERIIYIVRSKIEWERPEKFPEHLYQRKIDIYEKLKEQINEKMAKYTKPCFGDFNHKELTGIYLENRLIANENLIGNFIDSTLFKFNYDEYEDLLHQIEKASFEAEKAGAENSGLKIIKDEFFLSSPSNLKKHELFLQLQELNELLSKLLSKIIEFQSFTNESFDKKNYLKDFETATFGIFSKKLNQIHRLKKEIWKAYINLDSGYHYVDFLNVNLRSYDSFKSYSELNSYISKFNSELEKCLKNYSRFWVFQEWRRYFLSQPINLQAIIKIIEKLPFEQRTPAFKSWYLNECLKSIYFDENLQDLSGDLVEFDELKESMKETQIKKINYIWFKNQKEEIKRFNASGINIKRLYNYRKNKDFGRRNSLRNIIETDFNLFSGFFPVVLTSPVSCSSVLPMKSGLFDVVIFDEASQLRIEDTFSAFLRGKYKVISGDRHQMPPSGYFQSALAINTGPEADEKIEESAFLADSESLLYFAEENSISQTSLQFHYRSRHPSLIDFSNAAFYGNKLVPMPEQKAYKAVRFVSVDGIYKNGENLPEALAVVDIIATQIAEFDDGTMPTIGVATTNIFQRNLIWDKIIERSLKDAKFAVKFSRINANQFFVKNLENIQGDERDIIIISTTFGPDEEENMIQNFGPLNQSQGYRLLNVIVTRAKHLVYVCSSIPSALFNNYRDLISKNGNTGRGIFYAYLAYAFAIEQNNETERNNILRFLSSNCKEAKVFSSGININGPFQTAINNFLCVHVGSERIKSPYQIGGFWIENCVLNNNNHSKKLAIDCNGGYDFDDNESYIHLSYRQKLLQRYGIDYHPVLSLKFWNDPEMEFSNLMQKLNNQEIS